MLPQNSETSATNALPVTVVGGYLGVGKTTLVNHLLRNANGLRLAILCNEFGELPIDEDLIETVSDNLITIAGGCVCCSYGNDLVMAMMDLAQLDPAPDHVVLESSGVAIPGAIARSVSLLTGYQLDGIVVLADAETIMQKATDQYVGDTVTRQLADADFIILNKTDLVSEHTADTISQWLYTQFENTVVIPTSHSKLPPEVVLQSFSGRAPAADQLPPHHIGTLVTYSYVLNESIDPELLANRLANSQPGMVRAKGFVRSTDNVMHTVQVVGNRWSVTPAPTNVKPALVCIGSPKASQRFPDKDELYRQLFDK